MTVGTSRLAADCVTRCWQRWAAGKASKAVQPQYSDTHVPRVAPLLPALALVPGDAGRFVSTATYVIQADAADEDDRLRATTNLSDAPQISGTFAHVTESELITDRALDGVGVDTLDGTEFEVDASVVAGSNISSRQTAHTISSGMGSALAPGCEACDAGGSSSTSSADGAGRAGA